MQKAQEDPKQKHSRGSRGSHQNESFAESGWEMIEHGGKPLFGSPVNEHNMEVKR